MIECVFFGWHGQYKSYFNIFQLLAPLKIRRICLPQPRSFKIFFPVNPPPQSRHHRAREVHATPFDGSPESGPTQVICGAWAIPSLVRKETLLLMAEIRLYNQLRLVVYPIIYKVLYILGGCLEFLPSTVGQDKNLAKSNSIHQNLSKCRKCVYNSMTVIVEDAHI